LGLLGTASGLVTIFQGLGETTDYLAIARGIAEALSTTIFGLAITVPCVVAHSYFMRRIERLTARMESILTSFTETCSNSK
jgi:biopolymer transport protein ExbB